MTVALAREIAARVAALDGVVAVALGGSAGRGLADERSDLDLALYYDPARPFSVAELAALAAELDDHRQGGRAPWGSGGVRRRGRRRAWRSQLGPGDPAGGAGADGLADGGRPRPVTSTAAAVPMWKPRAR